MNHTSGTAPITIRTTKETVGAIDALAGSMDRSRNYVVNQAIQQYLDTHAWQVERIQAGLAAAEEGRVRPADAVFSEIAAKHDWRD